MSLTFHWFLPTAGDGRGIVGRGHSTIAAAPDDLSSLLVGT
jgi:hypothetical protein